MTNWTCKRPRPNKANWHRSLKFEGSSVKRTGPATSPPSLPISNVTLQTPAVRNKPNCPECPKMGAGRKADNGAWRGQGCQTNPIAEGYPRIPPFHRSGLPIRRQSCQTNPISGAAGRMPGTCRAKQSQLARKGIEGNALRRHYEHELLCETKPIPRLRIGDCGLNMELRRGRAAFPGAVVQTKPISRQHAWERCPGSGFGRTTPACLEPPPAATKQ